MQRSMYVLGLLALSAPTGAASQSLPDGTLLVANMDANTVSVVDLNSGETRATVDTHVPPHEVAVSTSGRLAAVTNYGDRDHGPGNVVQFVDVASGSVTHEIAVEGYERLHGAAFLLGDSLLALTSERTGEIVVVGTGDGAIRRVLSTGGRVPHMLSLAGPWVYATNMVDGTLARVAVDGEETANVWPAGSRTEGVAATPDGTQGWTGSMEGGSVVGIDGESGRVVAKIEGLQVPYRLAVTPDGSTVVVTDPGAGTVVLIDRAGGVLSATVDVDAAAREAGLGDEASPQGVTLSSDGAWAFVAVKALDRVAAIHLPSARVVSFLEVGRGPDGIAVSPVTP